MQRRKKKMLNNKVKEFKVVWVKVRKVKRDKTVLNWNEVFFVNLITK